MQAVRSAVVTLVVAVIVLFVTCSLIAKALTPSSPQTHQEPLEW